MDDKNKIVIETLDGERRVEFTPEEFNELKYLTVKKVENGKITEIRILKITKNKHLIMS